jgi:hypothetical protein
MTKIHVLHENDAWLPPLRAAFEAQGLPYEEWFLDGGSVTLGESPPLGVFYNRMSASSHTRGHRYAPELTRGVLQWLECHGRRVINGTRALALEIDKLGQYAALSRAAIATPRTVFATGREAVLAAARDFGSRPFILKPNRGGKGLGVQLIQDLDALAAVIDSPGEQAPVDGIWLIQDYIRASEPFITRMEFIAGRFHYAVRVDTSEGFELCPADACALPEDDFCLADSHRPAKFRIIEDFDHPLIPRVEAMLAANAIEVAGVEFILDREEQAFVYDINTNTNYNGEAETRLRETDPGFQGGMERLAAFLGDELRCQQPIAAE